MKSWYYMPLSLALAIVPSSFLSTAFALSPLPATPPVPKNNPMTPEKMELGKALFFDPRISSTGTVSCNSCHNVMLSGDDNRPFSAGVKGQLGGRSSPTVFNAAFLSAQFWDGRAGSLEDQAKGPIVNPVEMGMANHDAVVARLKEIPGYAPLFAKAFPADRSPINIDNFARAVATFERTLSTPNSPVDLFLAGKKAALSKSAQSGLKLVQEIGCTSCHSGPNFAGPALPEGTGFYQKFPLFPDATIEAKYQFTKDGGRFEATKLDSDKQMWRVPTWRNIAKTAPYFHNGSVATLDEAVRVMAKLQLNRTLSDDGVKDIVAFLEGLSGETPKIVAPKLPAGPAGRSFF
jgi:cytochrome c peroxidase